VNRAGGDRQRLAVDQVPPRALTDPDQLVVVVAVGVADCLQAPVLEPQDLDRGVAAQRVDRKVAHRGHER
jgi:hypothetical protein